MSKTAFLAAARAPAERITLSNQQTIEVRRFTQAEFDAVVKACSKIPESSRGLAMQRKLVALTVTVDSEPLTEDEVSMGIDMDLLREITENVSRVNNLNQKAEDIEGN